MTIRLINRRNVQNDPTLGRDVDNISFVDPFLEPFLNTNQNVDVDGFSAFEITLIYNSLVSKFSFDALFNPNLALHRELFRLGGYSQVAIEDSGERLITGVIINTSTQTGTSNSLSNFSGYSITGILQDSSIPQELFPLQFNTLGLREITNRITPLFGIEQAFDPDLQEILDEPYESIEAEPGEKVGSFLNKLAVTRNLVLSHDNFGRVAYTRANATQRPSFRFNESPAISFKLDFNGQNMFGPVVVVGDASFTSDNVRESTIENPYVPIFKPIIKKQQSDNEFRTEDAARAELGNQLRNLALTITLQGFTQIDTSGNRRVVRPNEVITVLAPSIGIAQETNFFIESVQFKANTKSRTSVLKCVLVDVFTNTEVTRIL